MKKIIVLLICLTVLFTSGCVSGGEIENTKNNIYINEKDGYKIEFPESWGDYYNVVEYDDGGIGIYFRGKSDTSKKYENEGAGPLLTIMPESKLDLGHPSEVERAGIANGINYYIVRSTGLAAFLFDVVNRGDVPEYDLELAKSDLEMQLKICEQYNQFILTELAIEEISVLLNNKKVIFDQEPAVVDGRTLVPVRKVVEAMKGTVNWNDATQTVMLSLNGNTIKLTVDSKTAYLNGEEKKLDVPPQVINGRTLMPIRFIAEGFSFNVEWNDETQTVIIRTGDGTCKDVTDSISGEWLGEFDSFVRAEAVAAEISGYLKTSELHNMIDRTHYNFLKNYDCNERNDLRQIVFNFISVTNKAGLGDKLQLQGFDEKFSGCDSQDLWGDKAAYDILIKEYYNIPYDMPEFDPIVDGYSVKEAILTFYNRYYSPMVGVGVSEYTTDVEKVYDLKNNQYYFEYKLGSGVPGPEVDYIFGNTLYALMERKNITNEYVSNLEFWSVIKTSETSFIDEITK